LNNNPTKFHPDPILNDGALGFLGSVAPTKKEQEEEEHDD